MLYILGFSHPMGNPNNPRGQAYCYLGSCEDWRLDERLQEHHAGRGAKITAAAVERGFRLELIAILPGTREDERRLKTKYKNTRKLVERLARGTLRYGAARQQ
jgi:predicted GIY-YIG superfamily endonuclease